MKSKLFIAMLLVSGSVFACNSPHFGLALNQRSFYNPAALCPYCTGSSFMSTGMNFISGVKNTYGMYYAFGNDDSNILHGPWDLSYNVMKTPETESKAFSLRYAYAISFGNWKAAIGMRGSYYSIREFYKIPGSTDIRFSTKMFDADAGIMLTNQKGLYTGISILHLGSPEKTLQNENGIYHTISTIQTINIMAGYTQKITDDWDVLPDLSLLNNKLESVVNTGALIRFKHHYALGGGMQFVSNEKTTYELRGGYTSSKFKWLVSARPGAQGWNVETGIVWRFWFTQECDGGVCSAKKTWKKMDDFLKHR